jgi:hypothetical protein
LFDFVYGILYDAYVNDFFFILRLSDSIV